MYRPYASVAAFAGIITMLALAVLGQQQTTAPVSSPPAAEKVAQRPSQGQTEASQDEVRQLLAAPRKPEPPKAAPAPPPPPPKYPNNVDRSEEHTSELQSRENLVCRLLLEKKNQPILIAG